MNMRAARAISGFWFQLGPERARNKIVAVEAGPAAAVQGNRSSWRLRQSSKGLVILQGRLARCSKYEVDAVHSPQKILS